MEGIVALAEAAVVFARGGTGGTVGAREAVADELFAEVAAVCCFDEGEDASELGEAAGVLAAGEDGEGAGELLCGEVGCVVAYLEERGTVDAEETGLFAEALLGTGEIFVGFGGVHVVEAYDVALAAVVDVEGVAIIPRVGDELAGGPGFPLLGVGGERCDQEGCAKGKGGGEKGDEGMAGWGGVAEGESSGIHGVAGVVGGCGGSFEEWAGDLWPRIFSMR